MREILNVILERVNGETSTYLEYFGFLSKNVHETLDLLK